MKECLVFLLHSIDAGVPPNNFAYRHYSRAAVQAVQFSDR
jgi:hypothetical protein